MSDKTQLSDKSKHYILGVIENLFKLDKAQLLEVCECLNLDTEKCYIDLYNDNQLQMRLLYLVIDNIHNNIINVYKIIGHMQKQ